MADLSAGKCAAQVRLLNKNQAGGSPPLNGERLSFLEGQRFILREALRSKCNLFTRQGVLTISVLNYVPPGN